MSPVHRRVRIKPDLHILHTKRRKRCDRGGSRRRRGKGEDGGRAGGATPRTGEETTRNTWGEEGMRSGAGMGTPPSALGEGAGGAEGTCATHPQLAEGAAREGGDEGGARGDDSTRRRRGPTPYGEDAATTMQEVAQRAPYRIAVSQQSADKVTPEPAGVKPLHWWRDPTINRS